MPALLRGPQHLWSEEGTPSPALLHLLKGPSPSLPPPSTPKVQSGWLGVAGWAAPLLEIPSRLIPTSLRFLLLWLSRAAIAGLGVGPSPHLGLPGSPRLGPWLQAHTGEADPPPLSRKHRLYAGACSALRPPRRGDVPSLRAQSGLSSSHRSLVRIERLVAARSRVAGTATHPSQQLLSYWPPQALFLS